MSEHKTIGKNVPKVDIRKKVTGQAQYAADLYFPGMYYGKIVRCMDHAHARVKRLDFSAAQKIPGVIRVIGPDDVTDKPYNTGVLDLMVSKDMGEMLGDIEDQHIFTRHVKHQGDAICAVIARTEEAAEQAAQAIVVDYEPLPAYMTAAASAAPDAEQFTPEKPGNRAFQLPAAMFPGNELTWGDVDAAFAEADFVVEDSFYVPKQKQAQMEPHAYIARYEDDGRLVCWTSTQMPKLVQNKLARLFDLPMSRVKLNQTVIGGGFGTKLGMVGEPETCAMAMAVPGHYVKVLYTREEDWLASESRHPGDYWMKIGFKNDGTPLAIDARFVNYKGGYYTHGSGTAFTTGGWLAGMYKVGALRYRGESYYTNQAPSGAFRGYGNPQTNFVLEQLIDRACAKLGIDPVEWRIKWHKDVGDDGWCAGVPYLTCALSECLERGAEAIGWKEKREKYAKQTGPIRRGIGVSVMNHTSGAMPMLLEHTVCTVKLNEDASVEVLVACSDMGQGSHTALQQIAAETLGLPFERIHMKTNDSDDTGFDIGAHASRTVYVGGRAVMAACEDVKNQLRERACVHFERMQIKVSPEDLEVADGQVRIKDDPEKAIDVAEIASVGIYNFVNPQTGEANGVPGQIQGYASYLPSHNSPPFGACFIEVEVDTETGEVKVIESVNTHDIGCAIHPDSVEGQMDGGLQQGLGNVLTEEIYYDENGLCLNSSFTDYKMFGPSDMPKSQNILIEEPDPEGPFGAKSVGEAGAVTPIGATANAIFDAIGVQFTHGPITPEKILKKIKEEGLTF
jgi:xanthine dehydrogenase molybdenum-binding subunit